MPAVKKIGGLNVVMPVYKTVSLTNLLANSNFDALTGWNYNDMASASVSGNVVTALANNQYDGLGQFFSVINTHKYYHTCWQNSPNDAVWTQFYDSANSQYIHHSSSAGYEYLSGVYTSGQTSAVGVYLVLLDTRASGWTELNAKYASVIDLTAAFGAGYEPTAAQMDMLMEQFPNRHFTGTANALCEW